MTRRANAPDLRHFTYQDLPESLLARLIVAADPAVTCDIEHRPYAWGCRQCIAANTRTVRGSAAAELGEILQDIPTFREGFKHDVILEFDTDVPIEGSIRLNFGESSPHDSGAVVQQISFSAKLNIR